MEEIIKEAKDALGMYGKRPFCLWTRFTVLIRGGRITLLPFVEDGTVILIGATTENPYFEVNGALLSRSHSF